MFDKIEIFSKRYDELNNRLYDPTVASDATKFNEIMKEVKSIEPIVLKYREYKKAQQTIKDSLEILETEKDKETEESTVVIPETTPETSAASWYPDCRFFGISSIISHFL